MLKPALLSQAPFGAPPSVGSLAEESSAHAHSALIPPLSPDSLVVEPFEVESVEAPHVGPPFAEDHLMMGDR